MEQFVRQGISSYLDIIPVLCQNTMLFKRENTVLPPTAFRRAVGIRFSSGRAPVRPYTQKEVGRYGFLSTCHPRVPGTTGIHCPRRVTAGSEVNPDYGRDEMPIYGVHPPEAAVEILSTEEAAAVVKLCYAHNIPVTTRGAGTGLVGGCVPVFGGVVLSTARMNRILGYDLENFTVTVQPGVLLQQLAEDALSHGCLYPPDPGEKLATLGGNVSTNASGMRGVKYGATRDYVKAMTVVLPTERSLSLAPPSPKPARATTCST